MTLGDYIGAGVCVLAILGVVGGCIAGWRMEKANGGGE